MSNNIQSIKLHIPLKEFKLFLKSLIKISNRINFKIKDYKIEVMTSAMGDQILMLSTLSLPQIPENNVNKELVILDINKLLKICDFVTEDILILDITDNEIRYINDSVKLKLHIGEKNNNFANLPSGVTPEKLRKLPINFSANIDKSKFILLEKAYAFVKTEDLRIYFYLNNNKLYGELTDESKKLVDSFNIVLSEEYNGEFNGKIPIKFENWLLTDLPNDKVILETTEVNTNRIKYNTLLIRQISDNLEYSYLMIPLKN